MGKGKARANPKIRQVLRYVTPLPMAMNRAATWNQGHHVFKLQSEHTSANTVFHPGTGMLTAQRRFDGASETDLPRRTNLKFQDVGKFGK